MADAEVGHGIRAESERDRDRFVVGRSDQVRARRTQFADHGGEVVPGLKGCGELGQQLDQCSLVGGVAESQGDVLLYALSRVSEVQCGDRGAAGGSYGDRPGGLGLGARLRARSVSERRAYPPGR